LTSGSVADVSSVLAAWIALREEAPLAAFFARTP
jgi:hypothetical protein